MARQSLSAELGELPRAAKKDPGMHIQVVAEVNMRAALRIPERENPCLSEPQCTGDLTYAACLIDAGIEALISIESAGTREPAQ